MPFAGDAIPAAVTLLTQKRGGKTRGASETDAAVITTSGMFVFGMKLCKLIFMLE